MGRQLSLFNLGDGDSDDRMIFEDFQQLPVNTTDLQKVLDGEYSMEELVLAVKELLNDLGKETDFEERQSIRKAIMVYGLAIGLCNDKGCEIYT